MRVWKILVSIPYVLVGVWVVISFLTLYSGNIGGIFIGAAFLSIGIVILLVYSVILGIALLLRWIILRKRAKQGIHEGTISNVK